MYRISTEEAKALNNTFSKEKSGREKAHDVVGNVGNMLKGALQFLLRIWKELVIGIQ